MNERDFRSAVFNQPGAQGSATDQIGYQMFGGAKGNEKEFKEVVQPFISSLQNNKEKVMQATGITGDVYNEIARMSFGILGTESNFGDEHSAVGNLIRAGRKALNPEGSSSPDYKAKATTYGADEDFRSVGLTQVR